MLETEGTPFGRYLLQAQVGRGGMGIVYRAWDPELGRAVALKTLVGDASTDRTPSPPGTPQSVGVARFLREARAAARLVHPNVIPVYDVGQQDGRHYFTMELVDGVPFDRWARGTAGARPTFVEIARTLEGAARGLHYAHAEGIVHRDVKPGNLLVELAGRARLGDFGLAKDVELPSSAELTRSGSLIGTPTFMSPEQAGGEVERVGPLADVYSLGAVLYFALAGAPPFDSPSLVALLKDILEKDPVPPSRRASSVPRELEVICLRALEKDPRSRYASAGEMADDLGRFARGEAIHARPRSAAGRLRSWLGRRRRALVVLPAIALSILAAVVAWKEWRRASERAAVQERRRAAQDLLARADTTGGVAGRRRVEARLPRITEAIEADPGFALAWLARGRDRERIGDLQGALADLREAVRLDPGLAEAWYHIGTALLWRGAKDNATREAREAFARAGTAGSPGFAYAALGEACLLALDDRREEALARLAAVPASQANHPDLCVMRGALHSYDFIPGRTEMGRVPNELIDLDGALADLDRALELDPLSPWGLAVRGGVRFMLMDFPGAKGDLGASLALAPDNPSVLYVAARADVGLGDYDAAHGLLSRAIDLRPSTKYLFLRSTIALNRRDYKAARADLERGVKLNAGDGDIFFLRALLLEMEGEHERAKADVAAALYADQKRWDDFKKVDADLAKNTGVVQTLMASLADADRVFALPPARKKALRDTQRGLAQIPWFGVQMKKLGDPSRVSPEVRWVLCELSRLLEVDPDLAAAHTAVMKEMGIRSPLLTPSGMRWIGRMIEEQALMQRKRLYRAEDLRQRAAAHYRFGRTEDALADIQEAERLAPGDADVLYALATLRSLKGDAEGAIDALRRAMKAGWGHPEYTREDIDFAPLRDRTEFAELVGPR